MFVFVDVSVCVTVETPVPVLVEVIVDVTIRGRVEVIDELGDADEMELVCVPGPIEDPVEEEKVELELVVRPLFPGLK